MNALNRTLLATLTVCGIAFTHGAGAADQVKSDAVKIQNPVKIKNPVKITNPIDVKTLPVPTQDKLSDAPSANSKTKCGLSPIGQTTCK
jgi:hypothetical protein